MKANKVLEILNITRPTLSSYVKKGLIKAKLLPTRQYDYEEESVYAFIGSKRSKNKKINVTYSRVSSQVQKSQLKDQSTRILEYCISKGIDIERQFEDIKSGMSFDRKDFQSLTQMVIEGKIDLIVIENKDRLCRFGFEMLQSIFRYFGTRIIVISEDIQNKSYEQELTEDLLAIIHHFSMKSYSHRRKLNKLKKSIELEESL
ncbi:IS607 family transposase [Campylobacter coli]